MKKEFSRLGASFESAIDGLNIYAQAMEDFRIRQQEHLDRMMIVDFVRGLAEIIASGKASSNEIHMFYSGLLKYRVEL